ncbi:Aspartate/glutamate/uridylate kinase [Fimicolochytrium jonesii]|uniref:Aspartate/glutamate/uridylate kinase n=1 Tax=Fimicolochytrium jonesii TaxID=1396493 RepID=UPI0022FE87B8|nr:Aspartate/glutamate/uridylate kinase [Fimicolochytrium jonesii]KAI8818112.1 Aspartate/glutamate/uridylate kinase [Fimicolochytrium jonesii]
MAADALLPLVVQKYGGTSVGNAERMLQVANIVRGSVLQNRVVVVLSAMSSQKKSEGTTSRLLEAVTEVLKPNSQRYLDIIDIVEEGHLETIRKSIQQGSSVSSENIGPIQASAEADIRAECQRLRSFMAAAEVIDEISPRSRDVIISTGEKLSARIFTALLQSQGHNAVYVDLSKLIDAKFDEKRIDQSFYDYLVQRLSTIFAAFTPQQIPVVTGYLGPVPGGILSTIGRGYTDLTAALVAVALKARELQIWKEVDGIFTADPRKAPRARLLPSISPEEAAELTYYGSEVIHPFTMEQVIRASIPIRIKNAFKPDGNGTVIVPDGWRHPQHSDAIEVVTPNGTRLPRDAPQNSSTSSSSPSPKRPTAVTIKENAIVLNVHSNRKSVAHGFFAHIFLALDRHGVVVDLISTSQVHVSMALGGNVNEERLGKALAELRTYGTVSCPLPVSCVCLCLFARLTHISLCDSS